MSAPDGDSRELRPLRVAAYNGMLASTVIGFFVIRHFGATLSAPASPIAFDARAATSAAIIHGRSETLLHVLLALCVVVLVARLLGAAFKLIHQPPVIGEVVAGILLGPSLLGRVAPDVAAYVLPLNVAPLLGVLSQVGIILYMFLVGLELDLGALRQRGSAMVAISHASIVVPFLLGAALALLLYPMVSTSDVPFSVFALFLGVAMSITAFPVLARILKDSGLSRTPLGSLAIACAAAGDVTAWCLLAFVVGVAQSRVNAAVLTTALTLGYVALMLAVVAPLARRFDARAQEKDLSQNEVAGVVAALLLSALLTEYIGVHAIFGAFVVGAVLPHDGRIARAMTHRLEDLVSVLLLPAFFAFTGLRTEIGLVSGASSWLLCALLIVVASVGKFGGSFVAARASGMRPRRAAALGVLMNTRGLMELIVLNIGLDLHVISPTLFAMMVMMALVTTVATAPILRRLVSDADYAVHAPSESG